MSLKLTRQVWKMPLPTTEKFVLLALADHANDEGICWPSQGALADATGCSKRTVIKAVKKLQESGLIEVKKSGQNQNQYRLSVVKILHDADSSLVKQVHYSSEADSLLEVKQVHYSSEADSLPYIDRTTKEPPIEPPKNHHSLCSSGDEPSEKSSKKHREKTAAPAEKKPRERDLLFDAIAEVCRLEPAVSGSVIGKCKQTLLKYNPPATPDEVRLFGQVYERKHPVNVVPTHGILANQFLLVRDKSTVERIMSGNNTPPRGLATAAQAYRDRIEQYDPSKSRPLTPEEKAEIEQEDIPF